MIGLLLGLVLLSWIFGRTEGLIGGLTGGFVGAFVFAGMVRTAASGELAALYTPAELASNVLPVTLAGALMALIAPYTTAVVSLAWAAGAVLAAIAVSGADEAAYIIPLVLHAACAASLVRLAWARTAQLQREPNRACTADG
jgi:hypothetical protein